MPIVPAGSVNISAIQVPNVYVQIIPPNPIIVGVPTNIVGVVGIATWGPVNSPSTIGSMQEFVQLFGNPQPLTYDLGTQVYNASQQQANDFVCVRVTDGTDVAASANLLDGSSALGAVLNSLYTGTLGNTTVATLGIGSTWTSGAPTYKLTIYINNGIPEVYDNIGGSGATFWTNLVTAVNSGQNGIRSKSLICSASLATYLTAVAISTQGSYATLPTFGTTGPGSGATLVGTMTAVSAAITANVPGSDYAPTDTVTLTGGTHTVAAILTVATTQLVSLDVNAGGENYVVGDYITLAGGTFSTAAVVQVATVSAGAVATITVTNGGSYTANASSFTQGATTGVGSGATFNTVLYGVNTVTIDNAGKYTALPSDPVSQGATSGSGSGATFTVLWGVYAVAVTAAGSGYTAASHLSVTGGGGSGGATGTLTIGSASTPAQTTYDLSGGLNGNNNVTDATLIGSDSATPRSGMYALRGSLASIGILADQTNSSYWTSQVSFGLYEGIYFVVNTPLGQENSISTAVGLKQAAGISSYAFKLMLGDGCYINDPYNNVYRLVSPQGFVAGIMATQLPNNSSLNKPISGIVATQKSTLQQLYSQADLLQIELGGLDVITIPIPAGYNFGVRIGINTSGSIVTSSDSYTRMINFLAFSINDALGPFIGQPYDPTVVTQVQSAIQAFLLTIFNQELIGNINQPYNPQYAYSVKMDTSQSAYGILIANVSVVFFGIIQTLVVNLQGGQSVTIQILPPALAPVA